MEVTREEAECIIEHGTTAASPSRPALARTVVALYDEREDLKKQYQSLLINSMKTATAQRECIDRLRDGWVMAHTIPPRWFKDYPLDDAHEWESMTPEQIEVMTNARD